MVCWYQNAQAEAVKPQEIKPEDQVTTAGLKRVNQPLEGDYWGFACLNSESYSITDPTRPGIGGEIK